MGMVNKDAHIQKGQELLQRAERKYKKSRTLSEKFFGGTSLEEARDLYSQAREELVLGQDFKQAAEVAMKQAKLAQEAAEREAKTLRSIGTDSEIEEITDDEEQTILKTRKLKVTGREKSEREESFEAYSLAHYMYRKFDTKKSLTALDQALVQGQKLGKVKQCAQMNLAKAGILEADLKDSKAAIESYEKAREFYLADDSPAWVDRCALNIAALSAELEDYDTATKIYEELAAKELNEAFHTSQASDLLFNALLCHLCVGPKEASNALRRYSEQMKIFQQSEESLLFSGDQLDESQFDSAVKRYSKVSPEPLDRWQMMLLNRAKRRDKRPSLGTSAKKEKAKKDKKSK